MKGTQHNSFRLSLFKNFRRVASYNYTGQILTVLASVVTSRLLTPGEYGLVAIITVFSAFITNFIDTGLTAAVIRHKIDYQYYSALQIIALLIGGVLATLMALLSIPIAHFYHQPALVYPCLAFSLIIFAQAISIIPISILTKQLKFKIIARIGLIGKLVIIILTIILALLHFSYWALIIPLIISPLVINLLCRKYIDLPIVRVPKSLLKPAFGKTKKLLFSISTFTFFNYWARNADNLVIGKLCGNSSLGIYNRAYSLLQLPMGMLTGVLANIMLPSFQKLIDEGHEIKTEYIFILKMINKVMFPFFIVLMLFPHKISIILWGAKWENVGNYLPIFAILLMLQSMNSTSGNIFILHRKEKLFSKIGSINAIIMIIAIILGAQISLIEIAYFYAYSYIFVCSLILFYWGYIKAFNFSVNELWTTFATDWFFCAILIIDMSLLKSVYLPFITILYGLIKLYQSIRLIKGYKHRNIISKIIQNKK